MPRLEGSQTPPARGEADAFGPWEEQSLREKAEGLLSVADCVMREGWGDTVAAHLRQAAQDLLRLARPEELAR
jgi:hypothetical protein